MSSIGYESVIAKVGHKKHVDFSSGQFFAREFQKPKLHDIITTPHPHHLPYAQILYSIHFDTQSRSQDRS